MNASYLLVAVVVVARLENLFGEKKEPERETLISDERIRKRRDGIHAAHGPRARCRNGKFAKRGQTDAAASAGLKYISKLNRTERLSRTLLTALTGANGMTVALSLTPRAQWLAQFSSFRSTIIMIAVIRASLANIVPLAIPIRLSRSPARSSWIFSLYFLLRSFFFSFFVIYLAILSFTDARSHTGAVCDLPRPIYRATNTDVRARH